MKRFCLDLEVHQFDLNLFSYRFPGTFSVHASVSQLFQQTAKIDRLAKVERNFFSSLEYIRRVVREDLFHSNMPDRHDYGRDWRIIDHPTNAPFETDEFFSHVNSPFWKDVHPFSVLEFLDAKVDRILQKWIRIKNTINLTICVWDNRYEIIIAIR